VVLILFGRDLENRAKGRTGKAIQSLLGLRVKTAQVRRAGEFVDCPIEEIVVGDVLSLRPVSVWRWMVWCMRAQAI